MEKSASNLSRVALMGFSHLSILQILRIESWIGTSPLTTLL